VSGPGWQLAASGPEAYERHLVPRIFASWAERLVAAGEVAVGDRVLDVGTGTGVVAREAARRVGTSGTVVGLDVNEKMLDAARSASEGPSRSIEWRSGAAADLPFPDAGHDVVLCQQALQFVPEPTAALGEMRRVLVPGGRLAVSVWRPIEQSPAYPPLARTLGDHVGPEAERTMRSAFPSWTAAQLRHRLADAGFSDVTVRIEVGDVRYPSVREFVRQEAASSPLAGPIGDMDAEARDELLADLTERLADRIDDEGVVSAMESWVALARVPAR
jgi:ubiquinone/menaquinone biosynthesis C-methylase UbiE